MDRQAQTQVASGLIDAQKLATLGPATIPD
jgi:hypothetical protein